MEEKEISIANNPSTEMAGKACVADLLTDENPRIIRFSALLAIAAGGAAPIVLDPPIESWELEIARLLNKELFGLLGVSPSDEQQWLGAIAGLLLFNPRMADFIGKEYEGKKRTAMMGLHNLLRDGFLSGLAEVIDDPNDEIGDFFEGLARGAKANFGNQWRGFKLPRTILYFVLLAVRDKVVACRSISELHNFLRSEIPELSIPDLESFQRLCSRIKLRLKRPGRTPKPS